MNTGIESITDRRLFNNILEKFFINKISFIHNPDGNIEVKFLEAADGLVNVHMPVIIDEPKNCVVSIRNGNNMIFVFLKFCGEKAKNTFIFNPTKFQVVTIERKDERKYLNKIINKKYILYATNLVSEIAMNNSLDLQANRLTRIKEIIEYDNKNEFEYLKIYFINEGRNDARMKYFHNSRDAIYIPDVNISNDTDPAAYEYYKNRIFSTDSFLNDNKHLISEISVPVLFNSKIPYGYVQVNNNSSFAASYVPVVKRIAFLIDDLIRRNNLFPVLHDKILISDISKKGVGIVFKNKNYIPHYKKNSYVSLDIIFPSSKTASLLANVKHLEMMANRIIKVGFEIKDMDNASMNNYDNFLRSLDSAV